MSRSILGGDLSLGRPANL